MEFYQQFSQYYDDIFPLQEEKLKFLTANVPTQGQVLDVAAGTGNYALALAEAGYQVQGLDLSEAMIELARQKAEAKGADVEFKTADMRNLSSIYSQQKFDLVYCIGNSLVHLDNQAEITKVLQQIYQLLADQGSLVLQIVNYNRILEQEITSLPTITNQEKQVKLIRKYNLQGDKVEFQTKLHTPQGQFNNSVALYPLTWQELQSSLKEAGFAAIDFYGGFDGSDYLPGKSFPLVTTAVK